MIKKRGNKRIESVFLIVNLIISIIAFSFLISLTNIKAVSGIEPPKGYVAVPNQPGVFVSEKNSHSFWSNGVYRQYGGASGSEVPPSWFENNFGINNKPTPIPNPAGPEGFLASLAKNKIVSNLFWATLIGFGASMLAGMIAPANSNADEAGFWAGFVGYGTFAAIENIKALKPVANWFSGASAVIGLGVGIAVFVLLYKEESKKIVSFECNSWEAPSGGADCEKCNNDPENFPCSEYKCKSLGQSCELLNAGTSEEKCTWVNRNDVISPGIAPWEEPLTDEYKYTNVRIRPPGDGSEPGKMTIEMTTQTCVKAFTPLQFGIAITEPAQCKIDYNHTQNFEAMAFYFGESNLYRYNHTQKLSLPGPSNIKSESPELINDGTYTLYVRCKDRNENENNEEFAIRFCVDAGPDVTPPKIEETSIINGMPVSFGLNETKLDVYVNEPAECKWSHLDAGYENMENQMQCQTSITQMNNNLLYKCSTTLTGIQNQKENVYYFRCKDQPFAPENERNENKESYKFVLQGTQLLNILKVSPNNETIKGYSTLVPVFLKVETANGYKQGDAICSYTTDKNAKDNDYIKFFETGTNEHEQRQDLPAGTYNYYFRCIDLGGNTAYDNVTFDVEVDQSAPDVVRAYNDMSGRLKIITNEDSTCSYSNADCNFAIENGINMPNDNSKQHTAEWKIDKTFYIRCRDEAGNEPYPNRCSIIIRPWEKS